MRRLPPAAEPVRPPGDEPVTAGRQEPRTAIDGWARLEPELTDGAAETAALENISRGGARIRARGHWEMMQSVILTWLGHAGPLKAHVIYRHATGDGAHAIGVRFDAPLPDSARIFSASRLRR